MKIKSLHIYPIKSGQGVDLGGAEVRARGLAGDRRFMLVDASGKFITQRQNPKLAQMQVEITDAGISISLPNNEPLLASFPGSADRKEVTVWRNTVDAALVSGAINAALSSWLGQEAALVYMDDKAERLASEKWTSAPSPVSFADGYPILITTTASLAALNNHILEQGGAAVPMTRFRPNIVVDCDTPWAEDEWRQIKIGGVVLDLVKPCTRCIMTGIDQSTGAKTGRAVLQALKTLRPLR